MSAFPVTPPEYMSLLQAEIRQYEKSTKYTNKLRECGDPDHSKLSFRFQEIMAALGGIVEPSSSVLDLGAACGTVARKARELSKSGRVAAVELVPGWVKEARALIPDVEFYNADASNFTLTDRGLDDRGPPSTFDVIYMADSFEHIPAFRKDLLWGAIAKHSKVGCRVYIHIPTPKKQRREHAGQNGGNAQFFEEVIEYDTTEQQARCLAGMRLDNVVDHGSGYASLWFTKL